MILRAGLDHDTAGFEVLELTALDMQVGIYAYQTGRACVVCGVALELAADHFDASALECRDAGHLTVRLSEDSTIKQQRRTEQRCINKF